MDAHDGRGLFLKPGSAAGFTIGCLFFCEFGNQEIDGFVDVRQPGFDVLGDILQRGGRIDRQSQVPKPQITGRSFEPDGGEGLFGLA